MVRIIHYFASQRSAIATTSLLVGCSIFTKSTSPFFLSEVVRKFCSEKVVRLAFAPLNLEPFALVGALPQALGRDPAYRATKRHVGFVGAM
jgi:hypothetical protein